MNQTCRMPETQAVALPAMLQCQPQRSTDFKGNSSNGRQSYLPLVKELSLKSHQMISNQLQCQRRMKSVKVPEGTLTMAPLAQEYLSH